MTAMEKAVKRFYKTVSVEDMNGGWAVLLDGRSARTVGRNVLAAPTKTLGDAIAAEWDAQGEFIERHEMPLNAILAASIDRTKDAADDPLKEILAFLKTDLVCYRAEAPRTLAERQCAVWNPYVEWLEATFGALLVTTNGIVAVAQSEAAIDAVRNVLKGQTPAVLQGIRMATEITGSAVLALALWKREFKSEEIFRASRVDETFQEERWGIDAEADARRQNLANDFAAVARFLELL